MANTSRVQGARPTKYLNGAAWNGQANLYFIPSGDGTATFVGDFVKMDGTGDPVASGGNALGVPSCIQAAATNALVGVIVAFLPNQTNLNSPQYRLGLTGRYCWVVDDPNVIFEIQSSNGTPAVGDVNNNVNIAVAAGSTTTGQSGMTADVGTILTTATLPLRIVGFSQRADNEIAASAKYLVKINNHQLGSGTGVLGV
jgi:hypothetical protein